MNTKYFIVTVCLLAGGILIGCNKESATSESDTPQAVVADFANVRCPIMNSPIDPDQVTSDLTREFNGETVAFCCGGCPSQWDQLSEEEKAEKLDAVRE